MKTADTEPPAAAEEESPAGKIARSRSELAHILTERPINPAFPRSRTMRALTASGPVILAGVTVGLLAVKPRWGARIIRLLPMVRMLRRLNRR